MSGGDPREDPAPTKRGGLHKQRRGPHSRPCWTGARVRCRLAAIFTAILLREGVLWRGIRGAIG